MVISLKAETDAVFQPSSKKKLADDCLQNQASLLQVLETGDLSIPRLYLADFRLVTGSALHHVTELTL